MIRATVNFLAFSLLIAGPPVLMGYLGLQDWVLAGFWYMYLFFFIITYMVCTLVIMGQQKSSKLGTQLFLIATIIKLLACMTFAIIYVQYIPVKPSRFILSFFYLYFLNTAFEIYTLLSNLRVQNKK